MLRLLNDAGEKGLTTAEWNERGRVHGIGKKRHATLYDIRMRLKDLRLVHEYNDVWKPNRV
jgi:hypothetical protein